jgi:4-amino-4-deoxy-L-arabinose transferase-like glycosyltransferase
MHAASAGRPSAGPSLESDARQLAVWIEKRQRLILCAITILYLLGAGLHARSKPFWYDEVITLVIANSPDLSTAWKAALACDASPPLPHLLTHLCVRWFGAGEISVRIPAIIGFWVFCLCLFRFTLKRVGIYYALAALLLPTVMETYYYSVEARAYGLELAFCGLALVAWQAAAERSNRFLALPGLALSIAGALLCHYYAALLYLPLAGGEAVRLYHNRKIDWGVWAAFAAGGASILWQISTVFGVVQRSTSTWALPYHEQAVEFWESGLQHASSVLVLLLALLALSIILSRKRPDAAASATPPLADYELAAGVLFLAIPVVGVAGAFLVTHMFSTRYVLIALAGFAFLTPMVAAHVSGGRALPGFLLTAALGVGFGYLSMETPPSRNPFDNEPMLREALQQGPVVVTDGQLFLQMWHYAPEPLRSRLVFVADNAAAVKYMGFHTIDSGLTDLRHWSSVPVVEYRSFASPGREFLVYQNILRPGWLISKVVDDGATVEIRKYVGARVVIRVRLKS